MWCVSIIYSNSISDETIIGEYVELWDDKNPHDTVQDTLKLYANGKYTSKEWGHGKYTVEQGIFETDFSLRPEGKGFMGLGTTVTRSLFGKPTIWLADDFGWRFEKYL